MKIVIAIDSFKGSMDSLQAGNAAAEGVQREIPDACVEVLPLADGGEGTVEALTHGLGARRCAVPVSDPLGRPVTAVYGITADGCAVMEMAAASGLPLLTAAERNPLVTTTYGVGEMIRHAIGEGCRDFLIGIGGSATNDGGVGMLQALGFSFLDGEGKEIPRGACGLEYLARIDTSCALPTLRECRFRIACDVKNPLCGTEGCSAVYGPQKGASAEEVLCMDGWLQQYASLTAKTVGQDLSRVPGAGAAGGLGFAFLAYLGGELSSGVSLVLRQIGLEQALRNADLVITGEGRLDGQSAMGKAPIGVAALAKQQGVPVVALCGSIGQDAEACNARGVDGFFSILPGPCSLADAMQPDRAAENMRRTAAQVARLWLAGR